MSVQDKEHPMPLFTGDPATAARWIITIVLILWLGSALLAGWAFHG